MYSSSDFEKVWFLIKTEGEPNHRDEQRTVGLQEPPSDDHLTRINCEINF
jgi:hypothetical protein